MAKKKSNKTLMDKIGVWAFVLGFVIALVVAIALPAGLTGPWVTTLVVLGFIVGLLNIADHEVNTYLIASVAFIVSALAFFVMVGTEGPWSFAAVFTQAIIVFTAPAALVVSFKALYQVARD